jgi:hypothetical protein
MLGGDSWVTFAHTGQQTLTSGSPRLIVVTAPPVLTFVSPTQAYNYQPTAITLFGESFVATPTATVGNVPLADVTFVNSTTLTAAVPAGLPGGNYALMVTNPDGQSASLPNAFTVHRSGDGALGPWQSENSMVTPRHNFAVAAAHGYLYALGGRNGGVVLSSVERARINDDGSLGPWEAVTPMTTARNEPAAVAVGDYLYVLGGEGVSDGEWSVLSSVERARINADGSLGPWEAVASMTVGRSALAAVAAKGYLYAIGSANCSASISAERAKINDDGTLGPWETTTPMTTGPRLRFGAATAGGYLYALGGDACGGELNSVERAAINDDGSLGPWQTVTSLTTGRRRLAAVATRGYLYAIGGIGRPEGFSTTLSSVERAAINADGSLGPWQTVTSMTTPRHALGAVAAGGYLYALGGESWNGTTFSSVERAAVSPPSLTSLSPSAAPTDRPTTVMVTGTNFLPTPTVRLGDATTLTTSFVSTNTLTATIPAGLASGYYAATLTNPDNQMASLANALRVDGTGPIADGLIIDGGALNSTAIAVVLNLSASDATDVATDLSMSFSNDGSIWSDWQPYSTIASWSLSTGDDLKTVYGRFRDPAGNVSSVVSDTIELDTAVAAEYGLTINDGALFTNQTVVTLTIGAEPGTAQMQVGNDGGFSGAEWEPYATHKAWEITQYGSYVIPRTVYVRYKDVSGNTSATYQDDIILDITPPDSEITELELPAVGTASRSATNTVAQSTTIPVTVRWTGADDVSGVKWYDIQVRTSDSAWTTWLVQTTETEAVYQAQPGQVYYFQSRAQDHAGNWEAYPGGEGHQSILVCPDFADPPGTDVGDVQVIAAHWHKQSTDPDWSSIQQFDLDRDGTVTVADIMRIVVAWAACS